MEFQDQIKDIIVNGKASPLDIIMECFTYMRDEDGELSDTDKVIVFNLMV
jgi:hypothetical protein